MVQDSLFLVKLFFSLKKEAYGSNCFKNISLKVSKDRSTPSPTHRPRSEVEPLNSSRGASSGFAGLLESEKVQGGFVLILSHVRKGNAHQFLD